MACMSKIIVSRQSNFAINNTGNHRTRRWTGDLPLRFVLFLQRAYPVSGAPNMGVSLARLARRSHRMKVGYRGRRRLLLRRAGTFGAGRFLATASSRSKTGICFYFRFTHLKNPVHKKKTQIFSYVKPNIVNAELITCWTILCQLTTSNNKVLKI